MDQRDLMISPDLLPAQELDEPENQLYHPIPPVPQQEQQPQLTVESLLSHIRTLTDNQNQLIGQLKNLKSKAEDPFLQFRTPDPIKNLATFSGNKKETHAWLEDADSTLGLFVRYQGDPVYKQLVRAVKNKIIGEAKEILIAAGNPNRWEDIKEIICNAYGDRRDLTSHIQSLFYINQGKKTIPEYYNKIKSIDTAIKSTAATMEDYKTSTKAINNLVSLMTLTRFIDGLNDELSLHVRSYKPQSLEEAYAITTQYSNAAYRQKLNKRPTTDKQNFSNSKPSNSYNNNSSIKSNHSNSNNNGNTLNTKTYGSGKFKTPRGPPMDDDVSMRTARSRTDVNNHESKTECKEEFDTPHQLEDSTIESEDDEYFIDDELNFHVGTDLLTKR